jgi:hypothetical protein
MNPAIKTIAKYWPVFLCVVVTAFFVYFPITDSDIFWHLAAGKEMIARKHFLYTDPFAYTLVFPRWIDLHWLFQLLCYGLYLLGAENALLIFKLVCVGLTGALLCCIHRSQRYVLFTALLTPFLFYHVRYLVDLRPVLLTLLFMALYVFLFERVRFTGKKRFLWWCVPLQIIWTNSQGLFMIGLFIIAAYWMESLVEYIRNRSNRPVLQTMVLFSCAASCCINPYGSAGFLLPFELFSRVTPAARNIYSLNISENIPLFSLSGYDAMYRPVVIITAFVACLLFVINRKNYRVAHLVLFAGFLFLACSAVRNVLLYTVIVIPIIGNHAASLDVWGRFTALPLKYRRFFASAGYAFALSALAGPLFNHASVLAACPPHRSLSPFRFPEKITGYIKRNPIPGTMFNDIRYGGYLLWHLYPEKKVFIDTRLVIRSPEFFAEYLAISDWPELFTNVAEKFNITHAILPSALFTRHLKLIRWLYESNRWRLACTDGASVLFVRNDIANYPRLDLSNDTTVCSIMDSIKIQWNNAPEVYRVGLIYFEDLLDNLGLHGAALLVKERRRERL